MTEVIPPVADLERAKHDPLSGLQEFDIVRVQLVTNIDNKASQHVAERCGFIR